MGTHDTPVFPYVVFTQITVWVHKMAVSVAGSAVKRVGHTGYNMLWRVTFANYKTGTYNKPRL